MSGRGWWLAPIALALVTCEPRDVPRDTEPTTDHLAARAAVQNAVQSAVDDSRRTALVRATNQVAPAVVSVAVTSRRRVEPRSPWDLFFVPEGLERTVTGWGTGFIIRPDGTILTNQHVVSGAERIVVTLADGTELPARLLGEDPVTDIAVLKVEASELPTAPLGSSTDLMIGEWVLALGNPYSYLLGNSEPTVTAGVVSATGRNILPSDDQPGLYLDMIQTDAAINPGNSGGPLTNALGEVVGVNSSIFTNSGGSVGLGFAIPIERAMDVAEQIIETGGVRRAWTGLKVEGAASLRDWKSAGGVTVATVAPGGPAAEAGIEPGDVLVSANGEPLRNYLDWEAVKLDLDVGETVQLDVREDDDRQHVRLVTDDLPTVAAEKITVLRDLQVITVTPAIQAERGLRSGQGALVFAITDELADATGLRSGDVILAINRMTIRSADQLAEAFRLVEPGRPFRIYFERDGHVTFTDLVLR